MNQPVVTFVEFAKNLRSKTCHPGRLTPCGRGFSFLIEGFVTLTSLLCHRGTCASGKKRRRKNMDVRRADILKHSFLVSKHFKEVASGDWTEYMPPRMRKSV